MILAPVSHAAPLPWKNGGGVTRELLRLPAHAGEADWALRISVADIAADGPFSPFAGVTRWFAVLSGHGVDLRFAGRALAVRAGDPPLRFDGADAPDCALIDGATRDLNVMVRRARADVRVTRARFRAKAQPGRATGFGLFALQALSLRGAEAAPVALPAWSLAWCEAACAKSAGWTIEPSHGEPEHALPGYWIALLPPPP
jgi:environmental stress-induced protein Ves